MFVCVGDVCSIAPTHKDDLSKNKKNSIIHDWRLRGFSVRASVESLLPSMFYRRNGILACLTLQLIHWIILWNIFSSSSHYSKVHSVSFGLRVSTGEILLKEMQAAFDPAYVSQLWGLPCLNIKYRNKYALLTNLFMLLARLDGDVGDWWGETMRQKTD